MKPPNYVAHESSLSVGVCVAFWKRTHTCVKQPVRNHLNIHVRNSLNKCLFQIHLNFSVPKSSNHGLFQNDLNVSVRGVLKSWSDLNFSVRKSSNHGLFQDDLNFSVRKS